MYKLMCSLPVWVGYVYWLNRITLSVHSHIDCCAFFFFRLSLVDCPGTQKQALLLQLHWYVNLAVNYFTEQVACKFVDAMK